MPRGDRTGPMGAGPMTGRAAGYCAGYDMPAGAGPAYAGPAYAGPAYANPMPGRGFGMRLGGGWGRGWRWRHWYYATGLPGWARVDREPDWGYGPYGEPVTREQEVESLKAQAGWLKKQLDAIHRCLGELEKEE